MARAITVTVLSDDPILREGAAAKLRTYREIALVDVPHHRRWPQVLLVLADQVTDNLLARIERAYREAAIEDPRVVLVADSVRDSHVLRAISYGLVCLLPRDETGFDHIVRAIIAARSGHAVLPRAIQRLLVDRLRAIERDVLTPLDLTTSGLTAREVDVLRLLSDGLDTDEVAMKLNYSQRTVKYILHGILTRFKLRNRTQAVAFALRAGAL